MKRADGSKEKTGAGAWRPTGKDFRLRQHRNLRRLPTITLDTDRKERGLPMFIAMNRFRVAKGSETAFEQVWLSRDSHLEKVPGFVEFHLLKGPNLRITRSTRPTPCGKTGLCSRHGPNQRRSGQRIVAQEITNRCILTTRNSRGSRCARRWDATR